ncbi:MAG: type II toxin-antitoxin system VapC family toxin [Spirochaetaceae bacterium]|nr:MAG: type II toxin-antitoxin system VapC family toxin [Spirochaetaceae bacterium]
MILLDTCVVSEAMRPDPSARVMGWIGSLPEHQVYLPTIVLGELKKGVDRLDEGQRRTALELWLEQLRERFRRRTVAVDEETAMIWGALLARLDREGRRMPAIDSLIAACALRNDALLATRNTTDYAPSGVRLIDPWD